MVKRREEERRGDILHYSPQLELAEPSDGLFVCWRCLLLLSNSFSLTVSPPRWKKSVKFIYVHFYIVYMIVV